MAIQINTRRIQRNMRLIWLSLVALAAAPAAAVPSMRAAKFSFWFPVYEQHWNRVAREDCATQISDAQTVNRARAAAPCAAALDCILEHTPESIKTNLANAQVVLGLTPSILAIVGSDVDELAVLAWRRPALALLLGLGAPGMQTRQLFAGLEAAHVLERQEPWHRMEGYLALSETSAAVRFLGLIAPYVLALAAIANNITTSLDLDLRTVPGFRCGAIYMPMAWGLLGVFPAACAMLAMWLRYGLLANPFAPSAIWWLCARGGGSGSRDGDAGWVAKARKSLQGKPNRGWIGEALLLVAGLAILLQMIYGMALLSSLTPIAFWDALPIIVRYAISTIVCRVVLLVELDIIRLELGYRTDPVSRSDYEMKAQLKTRGQGEDEDIQALVI